MKYANYFYFFLIILIQRNDLHAQAFYDINNIQQIEISFSQPNWDYQMDTAKDGADGYILADWVVINGQQFDSVGVKYKGNSSYDSTYLKNPMHIALDEFKDQSYQGYTDIKLGNEYADPSMIREALGYSILGNYMDCPKSNYAQVFINGTPVGLFSNDESISKKFCSDHFYSSKNTFVKCNPKITSVAYRSSLKYLSADSSVYMVRYDMQSDTGWNDLVRLCDSLTNNPSSFGNVIDADRVIWMIAFNNVLVNLDSYSGAFSQNHYIYKDNTNHYDPVIWDLNMAFGGFPHTGTQGTGMGTLDTTGMQTMSHLLHGTDTIWPLIKNVIDNPRYKRMYIAHMRTIVEEFFSNNRYQTDAATLQSIIDAAVQADPNKFFTYSDFLAGMTTSVQVGSNYVPGISSLMSARVSYLQSTTEFGYAAPVVSNVIASDTAPPYLGQVTITGEVVNTNPGSVFLGCRFDKAEKFVRTQMYDDGAHNDGTAGDNIYGASVTMSSAVMQYYVYAENNDAGIFSPQRAEHEYYSLYADIQTAQPGEVVINEFLAVNQDDTVDENGAHEDWIELYNTTADPLNLFGLYLSDTYTNLTKFSFPQNSVIQPGGYFMLWADEDNTTTGDLHCNFKLSANGESLLLSNPAGDMLDSISFGAQTANHSTARCPNGTGPFVTDYSPSFKASNHCTDDITELEISALSLFPNPSGNIINVVASESAESEFEILNALGEKILSGDLKNSAQINIGQLTPGLYVFSLGKLKRKLIVAR